MSKEKIIIKNSNETLYYFAIICIFLTVLFSLPTIVGANHIDMNNANACGGRGHRNQSSPLGVGSGECICFSGSYGPNCQYKYCPFGKSLTPIPKIDHERNMPSAECSNTGICNAYTGKCDCRIGFEGRACERLACPKIGYDDGAAQGDKLTIGSGTDLYSLNFIRSLNKVPQCSGHGLCTTMREAGSKFNGESLVKPPVVYNQWDADIIQGCICDEGWYGVDCSLQRCPLGRDPLSTETYKNEEFILQCQADVGYFSLFVLGRYTLPISYDADPHYIKVVLESIGTGEVVVSMPVNSLNTPTVCDASSVISTSIKFITFEGSRPPIKISTDTSNSRLKPDGGTPLKLSGSDPVLRLNTKYTLTCPICANCAGNFFLMFGDSVTAPISITASSIKAVILSAIEGLSDLVAQNWENLDIFVEGADTVCDTSAASIITINMYSDYGNIPGLSIIDASLFSPNTKVNSGIEISSTNGNGTLYECSNQGYCNRDKGVCTCISNIYDGVIQYRAVSSDGAGGLGSKGDCGYLETVPTSCTIGFDDLCNGRGFCDESTKKCSCNDGWHGLGCEIPDCPMGHAWFDEPHTGVKAHQLAECSNMGICHKRSGVCNCRDGYSGAACDVMDCPRDPKTGIPCSGNGWCMSVAEIADIYGVTYGSEKADGNTYPNEWDAHKIYQCVCAAATSHEFFGNKRYPASEPRGVISGIPTGSMPIPGWSGYDCSLRNCPKGDNVAAHPDIGQPANYGGKVSKQRVVCTGGGAHEFELTIFGERTAVVLGADTAALIKSKIEFLPSVGNVTVTFPRSGTDNIVTACDGSVNANDGGFIVSFVSDIKGSIDSSNGGLETITTVQSNTKVKNLFIFILLLLLSLINISD
jgi:hypothetical protein